MALLTKRAKSGGPAWQGAFGDLEPLDGLGRPHLQPTPGGAAVTPRRFTRRSRRSYGPEPVWSGVVYCKSSFSDTSNSCVLARFAEGHTSTTTRWGRRARCWFSTGVSGTHSCSRRSSAPALVGQPVGPDVLCVPEYVGAHSVAPCAREGLCAVNDTAQHVRVLMTPLPTHGPARRRDVTRDGIFGAVRMLVIDHPAWNSRAQRCRAAQPQLN
jgi:hypothetical protein